MHKIFKFIQINIYKGKYLEALLEFLKKENPDIITMQEVTSGVQNFHTNKKLNLFELIKDELNLNGVLNCDLFVIKNRDSVMGNAVFSKYSILRSSPLILKKPISATLAEIENPRFFPYCPRHILDSLIDIGDQKIHALSWHGAWTAPPTDTRETLRQAKLAAAYLKSINEPFILGGDLNAIPQSKTIQLISSISKNLMEGSGVLQTTHPTVHKIVPRGFLIDYIFTSKHFKLKSLEVPQVTISDHLPVIAILEF